MAIVLFEAWLQLMSIMPSLCQEKSSCQQCSKQFGKPPTSHATVTPLTPFSLALPNIPAPKYHETLTSIKYDVFHRPMSTNVSPLANLASLLAPTKSSTSYLLALSSTLWIIDCRASSHMTRTLPLLSSYHPTPSHPHVNIANGGPCLFQGHNTTHVIPSLFFFTKSSIFMVSP